MKKILLGLLLAAAAVPVNATDVYAGTRKAWLEKAEALKPQLTTTEVKPMCLVTPVRDASAYQGWRFEKSAEMSSYYSQSMKNNPSVIVDFGRHMTGYYSFTLTTTFRAQDAPVRIKFTFGEVPAELNTPFDPFPGTLSRAWLQDEVVTVMQVDREITIDRRMACRYVKIELLGASPDFDFAMTDMRFKALSSAPDVAMPELASTTSQRISDIQRVSVETLRECMQTVYEDGPKRDRRLWIGDVYLESIANAYSFKNHDLTKRCLYLLAALAAEDGRLHANVFETPEPHPQYGSHCLDYSLLYTLALQEYTKATGDISTARDLWQVCRRQVEDALSYVDHETMLFNPQKKGDGLWLFFDWKAGMNPTTAMQGLLIAVLNSNYDFAKTLGYEADVKEWRTIARKLATAARTHLYDSKRGVFVSGSDKQVSQMSQIWMTLSGVMNKKEAQRALRYVMSHDDVVGLGAPYAHHYLVEALLRCGMNKEARQHVETYWGGMVDKHADTFWEVYVPEDEYLSPYNFHPINSYCHAWSCTPVYFIQKYPDIFQR